MSPNARRWLTSSLQLGISVGLLTLVFLRCPVAEVVPLAARTPTAILAGSLVAWLASALLDAARLTVMTALFRRPFSLGRALSINLVSNVYGFVFFGWVGGGGYRGWRLVRAGMGVEEAVVLLLVDRLTGLIGLVVSSLAVVAAAELRLDAWAAWTGLGTFVALLAAASAMPWGCAQLGGAGCPQGGPAAGVSGRWGRLRLAARALGRAGARRMVGLCALGALGVVAPWAWCLWAARGLGIDAPPLRVLEVIALVTIIQQLPLAVAGLGVRELGFEGLLSRLGAPPGRGVALGLLHLVPTAAALLAGLLLRHLAGEGGTPGGAAQDGEVAGCPRS